MEKVKFELRMMDGNDLAIWRSKCFQSKEKSNLKGVKQTSDVLGKGRLL